MPIMRKKKYLKGCPFCGKDKVEERGETTCYYILCKKCGAEGPWAAKESTARRLWNERVRSD